MDLFSEVLNKGVDGVRKKSGGKMLIHKQLVSVLPVFVTYLSEWTTQPVKQD